MFDIGAHSDNLHYTWTNNTNFSRINYIWTNTFNIQFLLKYSLDNSSTSTLSDHLILHTSWIFSNAYNKQPQLRSQIQRTIFNYKETTEEQ